MREIEFTRTTDEIRSIEEGEKEFVQIANILVKSLEWKLIKQIEADVLLWVFQKNSTEIILVYDDMDGMFLKTHDENFPLESLFNEINDILNKGL